MPVQIEHVRAEVNLSSPQPMQASGSGAPASGLNGIDRSALERLRPMVMLILHEELDRLRRQHG